MCVVLCNHHYTYNEVIMSPNIRFDEMEVIPLQSQYVGITAMHRFAGHLSASRSTMIHNQLQQKPVMHNPDVSLNQTGIEKQLSDSTFGKRVPEDVKILAIHRLSNRHTTWRTCIIYREEKTGIVGHIELKQYHTLHSRLGFTCNETAALNGLSVGSYVSKGTLLNDTPGVVDGLYSYGKNLNVCLGSFPGVAEDSFVFNEDVVKDILYDTIESTTMQVLPQQILLSINGTEDNPQLIPEPGTVIRKDNIIAVLRNIDPAIMPAQMSPKNMKTIDYILDDKIELQSGFVGVVVDISVIRDYDKKEYIHGVFGQLDRIAEEQHQYYTKILKSYRSIVHSEHFDAQYRPGEVRDVECTDRTTSYMVRLSMLTEKRDLSKNKIKLIHKGEELSPYTVEIHIRKTRTPALGSKFTDLSASKGVICETWPAHKMPVDHKGVVADVIASQTASMGRNIVGRLFSQYFDGVADNVARQLSTALNVPFKGRRRPIRKQLTRLVSADANALNESWDYMLGMYKIACVEQYNTLTASNPTLDKKLDYLVDVCHYGGAILTQTVDNVFGKAKEMVRQLEGTPYAPEVKPITYVDHRNIKVTTKNPIRIAPIIIIPLERDASESSATDTIRLQSQLFTATISKSDKFRSAMSASNVALLGIDESTIITSAVEEAGMAEFVDRLNSPKTHAAMVLAILESNNPTGEYTLVDRTKYGWGTTSANRTLSHTLNAYGSELIYTDDEADL